MNTPKWMRIKIQQLQILHQNPTVEAYYSVTFNEKLYFSPVFDDELTLQIKSDLIIPLQGSSVDTISLQRWQSHVIVFDHQILLPQLKTKSLIKKRFQARKNEIVTFTVQLCGQRDIISCEKLLQKTSQHYLILQNIRLKEDSSQKRGDYGASYFKIKTSRNQFDIPVQNGNCLIYLPQTFKISQYRNGKLFSSSKEFMFEEINDSVQEIQLYTETESNAGKVMFDAYWIIDASIPLPVHYLLLHSVQVLVSEFELKFDVPSDFIGSKVKVSCNNKMFQFNDELGNNKMIKIKKAIWVVCKTVHDTIQIRIQKNEEVLARIDILAEDLGYCQMVKFKQKLVDFSNPSKQLGMIKFNIQKSKGSQSPTNDQFWRQCLKKKSTGSLLIQQVSVCHDSDQPTSLLIKTEGQQKTINRLLNINFYQDQPLIYHTPVTVNPKPEETIYFILKGQMVNDQDFIGIAVINFIDIKLGKNPYEVDFYKNQQKLGSVNCIITKYLPLTFVKSNFQPEVLPLLKFADLKLSVNTLTLTPYFFSYKYDIKSEVFCIVQVNRVKKVLILQPTFQQLSFISSSTSDNLSFNVNVEQILNLKITMMIGDGINEEIYGTTAMSLRMEELREGQQISRKNVKFINFAQTLVGTCSLIVHLQQENVKRIEKQKSKEKLPFQNARNRSSNSKKQPDQKRKSISVAEMISPQQKEVRIVKNLLPAKRYITKDNHNTSIILQKKSTPDSKMISRFQQKQPVRLPLIKDKKQKQSFNDLLLSMNMRKRTKGGYDYNKTPEGGDKSLRDNGITNKLSSGREGQKSIDYHNLRSSNPNIEKNFQMLFPPKKGQTRQQQIKNELNKYEQKLRGLKSVLHEISNDIDPIEPSVKERQNTDSLSHGDSNNFQYAGNQFL